MAGLAVSSLIHSSTAFSGIFWVLLPSFCFSRPPKLARKPPANNNVLQLKMPSSPSSRPRQKPPLQLHRNLRPCVRFCMALHATYLRLFIAPCVRLAMALSTTLYDVSLRQPRNNANELSHISIKRRRSEKTRSALWDLPVPVHPP